MKIKKLLSHSFIWIFLFFISVIFLFGVVSLFYFFIPKISNSIRNNKNPESITALPESLVSAEENSQETESKEKVSEENAPKENTSPSLEIKPQIIDWGFETPASKREIDTVIVHSSYCAAGKDVYDLTCILKEYKDYTVSAHYIIDRKGIVYQLVDEKNIAYHAGIGQTPDKRNRINNFSIGIEIMNTKIDKYTEEQYDSLNKLLAEIKNRYAIKYILGHDQISPSRKTDPWNFDWKQITK